MSNLHDMDEAELYIELAEAIGRLKDVAEETGDCYVAVLTPGRKPVLITNGEVDPDLFF